MLRRNDENAYTFAYVYTKIVLFFNLKPKENGILRGCNMPFFYAVFLSPYSGRLIASLGQTSAHVPHSVQASGLIA